MSARGRGQGRAIGIALSCAAACAPSPLVAAARADDGPEIVVTARREAESVQGVPLGIRAFGADALGAGRIDSLQSLSGQVPGLAFEAIWGGANSFPIMRGQSQPSVAGDNVGLFVDGVYQANRDAIDVAMLDLARVEVVTGPQSALFGHSTFAGLISYVPAEPAETPGWSASLDAGTDGLLGGSAMMTGPLGPGLKARLAASWREQDGTQGRPAESARKPGGMAQWALAGTLATRDNGGALSVRLSARYGEVRRDQPPFFTVDYHDYNCGGRDAASGVWTYLCGAAPVRPPAALSSGLPQSLTRTGQAALHVALDLGGAELRSDTSFYSARSSAIRDFDGTVSGEPYGICTMGVNCPGFGSLAIPVSRVQPVNIVQRRTLYAREWGQELRLRGTGGGRLAWQLGAAVFWLRQRTSFAYGADRAGLAANERYTALVLANPLRVGPLAAINNALAGDPAAEQFLQNDTAESRRTFALFAAAEFRAAETVRLRAEARSTWERLVLDSRRTNFAPSFGMALGPRYFRDVTPRFSLDWRPMHGLLAFASYARGSRSGGINPVQNLIPAEQTFEPETNWTAEIGLKYAGSGLVRSAALTLYDIDWKNTQILGLSNTPGVTALITRNTVGVHTRGVEAAVELVPARWLKLTASFSHTDPRFKAGSEDPGSGAYCGISPTGSASSFCTIRPSTIAAGQLVPDISGNLLLRAAPTSWTLGATVLPAVPGLAGLRLHAALSHRGDVYERAIDGFYYGARTLLDARISLPLGAALIELWASNLTDQRYVRADAGRPPQFYTGIPRPSDLILGEGRRIGLTLGFKG